MRIIKNKCIPFGGFQAVNILGVLFTKIDKHKISEQTTRHEEIHTAQMKEMWYVFFYLWYAVEWAVRVVIYSIKSKKLMMDAAYKNTSFEKEAYGHQDELDYNKMRKKWAWVNYI